MGRIQCRRIILFAVLFAAVAAGGSASGEDVGCFALLGRVIDGTGSPPIEDGVVLCEGGAITAVGRRENVPIPSDAVLLEASDATILPGFINTHVHSSGNRRVVAGWIRGGVTTVRDLGAHPHEWEGDASDLAGDATLPTILWAGPIVTVANGYPIVGNNFPSLAVTSEDHARRSVLRLIADGVDVVKIALALDPETPGCLPVEWIRAIVGTAHDAGLRVTAHINLATEARRALDGGVDELAHYLSIPGSAPWLPERMVEQGVAWVPTLAVANTTSAPELIEFLRGGGIVAMGDDAGYLLPTDGMPMEEIRAMRVVGMTPMEIIVASTANAAFVCQIDDRVGTLANGMVADILVVSGDPLADLEALDRPLWVLHEGQLVVNNVVRTD